MQDTQTHAGSPIGKPADEFRNYAAEARDTVKEFYRLNHTHQTLDFVLDKKRDYLALNRKRMKVWEALEFLDTLVDDSDPDVDFTQIEHAMQTAEAARKSNQPRWMIVTGADSRPGQDAVHLRRAAVGGRGRHARRRAASSRTSASTPEFFADNPDSTHPVYSTDNGIYEPGCGLDNIHLSWGHDEYVYHVVKDHLPTEALYALRYHSFYPWHKEGAYNHLANDTDREMMKWVKAFNRYDLYSKGDGRPDVKALRPYYEELVDEFFPEPLNW